MNPNAIKENDMNQNKKETSVTTEVSRVCPMGCDFKPIEADDRFCGKCGTKLQEGGAGMNPKSNMVEELEKTVIELCNWIRGVTKEKTSGVEFLPEVVNSLAELVKVIPNKH